MLEGKFQSVRLLAIVNAHHGCKTFVIFLEIKARKGLVKKFLIYRMNYTSASLIISRFGFYNTQYGRNLQSRYITINTIIS